MRWLSRIDLMVRLLVLAIVLASVLPAAGAAREAAQWVANAAIVLLFFLNGLRLARGDVLRGIAQWRLLVPLVLWCFGAMALAGKGFALALHEALPPLVALGFLYLGVLPSTVQSATAYSSLAGGNVASSVVAAALTNVLGVFLSAPLFAALGGGAAGGLGAAGLAKVVLLLILPFAVGQMLQPRLGGWAGAHRKLVTWLDRASIAVAVYVAMSGAVEQGLWGAVRPHQWVLLLMAASAFLAAAFAGSWALGRALGLARSDRIALLFAGAHKSVAMGAPLATVMFPPQVAGAVLVPLLVYHLLQLVASAPLASRLARAPRAAPDAAA